MQVDFGGRTVVSDTIDSPEIVLGSETPRREMKHIRDLHGLMQDELRWTQESDT